MPLDSAMFRKKMKKLFDADPDAPKMGTIPLPEVEDVVVLTAVQNKPKWRDECLSDGELMTRPRKPSIARSSTPAPAPTPRLRPAKAVDAPPRPSAPRPSIDCRIQFINLHWSILPYDRHRERPHLEFDITQHPDRARLRLPDGSSRALKPAELDKPAADKILTSMTIAVPDLPARWAIRIRRPEGVRIGDVLDGIFQAFHRPLTSEDAEEVGPERVEKCKDAFRRRCRAAHALEAWEERQGMRRVDMLRGLTMFCGLVCPPPTQDQSRWLLHLDKPRNPGHSSSYASGRPVY